MSEEKINNENVFEREIKLCKDFRKFESADDVIIFSAISLDNCQFLYRLFFPFYSCNNV